MKIKFLAGVLLLVAPLLVAQSAKATSAPYCGTSQPGRLCTFADEFDSSTLDRSKWLPVTTAASGYHSGSECFADRPENVAVHDGALYLTARDEGWPFWCASPLGGYATQYTSGTVSTYSLFSQTYGRFEVRAKLPPSAVKGLQESFWLWPTDATRYGPVWPQSGEIDIAEVYSQYNDRSIPYIHYVASQFDPNVTNNYCLISNIAAFHTYAVEWNSQTITIVYDSHTCLVDDWTPANLTKPAPFDRPFFLILTQALGIATNAFNPSTTPLPATTVVDYVHVWK